MSFLSKISFSVTAVVRAGETLMVSGDAPTLGRFNTSHALPLQTTPETYPLWRTAEPITVPRDYPLKYRCVVSGCVRCSAALLVDLHDVHMKGVNALVCNGVLSVLTI